MASKRVERRGSVAAWEGGGGAVGLGVTSTLGDRRSGPTRWAGGLLKLCGGVRSPELVGTGASLPPLEVGPG